MTMPKSFQDELSNLDELWLGRQAENQSPEELAIEVIGYILTRVYRPSGNLLML